MGSLSFDDFSDYIRASCLEKGRQAVVEERSLKALPSSQARAERAEVLADNGMYSAPSHSRRLDSVY